MHRFWVLVVVSLLLASLSQAATLPIEYLINDATTADTAAAAGAAAGHSRALVTELESELEETAQSQMILSVGLEQAAARAAREARLLKNEANAAKMRAFEAVAQEQAIANAERSLEAKENRLMTEANTQSVHTYLDPLMDSSETSPQKRTNHLYEPDTVTFHEPDETDLLEALRVRYLQHILAGREGSADLPELLEPADRLILGRPEPLWQEEIHLRNRNPIAASLIESRYPGGETREPNQDHLFASTIDELMD